MQKGVVLLNAIKISNISDFFELQTYLKNADPPSRINFKTFLNLRTKLNFELSLAIFDQVKKEILTKEQNKIHV